MMATTSAVKTIIAGSSTFYVSSIQILHLQPVKHSNFTVLYTRPLYLALTENVYALFIMLEYK